MSARKRELKVKNDNIRMMQRLVRGKIGRKMFQVRKAVIIQERKEKAGSEAIQKMLRGKLAKKKVAAIKQTNKENACAVQVQARIRMFAKRWAYKKQKAVTCIAKYSRMQKERKEFEKVRGGGGGGEGGGKEGRAKQ
jgi:hypothetical protein